MSIFPIDTYHSHNARRAFQSFRSQVRLNEQPLGDIGMKEETRFNFALTDDNY